MFELTTQARGSEEDSTSGGKAYSSHITGAAAADADGNGLIEICSLADLHNMRYDLAGWQFQSGAAGRWQWQHAVLHPDSRAQVVGGAGIGLFRLSLLLQVTTIPKNMIGANDWDQRDLDQRKMICDFSFIILITVGILLWLGLHKSLPVFRVKVYYDALFRC